ncbi:hypothetical protein B6S44_09650 [Bosea sp. Tri-44]|uniref:hypothetical protein n=1 Tax=Bosea sp. Tri-44 TaxID=1972137 RepID=UPI00100EA4DE|nr:hypothetical protein [Bosea sp. Tri-44]RXT55372.1 hypothetical protein B6S44_09650 [Bosea sp. Tri-44]
MATTLLQFVMLALVASIHVLNICSISEAKTWMVGTSPTMTERAVFMGSGLIAARCPGKTTLILKAS